MSRTNKKVPKPDFPAAQPAKMPDWATSLFSAEEAIELIRSLDETPLPQRINKTNRRPSITKQTINTNTKADQQQGSSGLQNLVTPSNSNASLNHDNNTNIDNSNSDNTGDCNQKPLTYGSSISGIASYKNNLLLTLLGEHQHQTTINSSPNTEVNTTEQNSPTMRISNKLKTFVNSLRPSINALCSTAMTIKTIGNLVSNGNIPKGCTPVCRLGITNPQSL